MLRYVIRDRMDYQGRGAGRRDGHLDFHTAPGLRLTACAVFSLH